MKAILVIDMPEACLDCPFEDFLLNSNKQIVEDKPICELEPGLGILEDEYDRPSWCPLKPIHALKSVGKDYIVYERQYLYKNLEREYELLKEARDFDESNISD